MLDGSTRTSTYDEASDVTGYVDENGSSFTNTFDVLGRKTAVAVTLAAGVARATTAQKFQYDGLSRLTWCMDIFRNGLRLLTAASVFDSIGRTIEEIQSYEDTQYITHDAWTSLVATDMTYPSGRRLGSAYDALYRRNAAIEASTSASIAAWQFFGNRTATVTLGNGIVCSFMNNAQTNSAVQSTVPLPAWGDATTDRLGYDGSGRLIAKRFLPSGSTTSLVGFTTAYDPSSNKLFERALHAESRSALYPAYDSMDRLGQYQRGALASGGGSVTTPITLPGTDSQRTYHLDSLGNWQSTLYTPEGGSSTAEIRQHNRLNEVTQVGATAVRYDHGNNLVNPNPLIAQRGNGNIIDDGTRTYEYDAFNRLVYVFRKSDGLVVAFYLHDALGRRVYKGAQNGGVSGAIAEVNYRYFFDGNQIVEEMPYGSDTPLRQFVWGQYIDELIQINVPATIPAPPLTAGTYYPLQDLLYRTTATTDSSGAIVEAYDYDAYGNTLMFNAPGTGGNWWADDAGTTMQPMCEFLFTGRQYDPETEIYWYRARYYNQGLGRFTGRDPIGYIGALCLFEYVCGRPAAWADPMGLLVPTPVAPSPGTWETIWTVVKEGGELVIDVSEKLGAAPVAAAAWVLGPGASVAGGPGDEISLSDPRFWPKPRKPKCPCKITRIDSRFQGGDAVHDAMAIAIQGTADGWLLTTPGPNPLSCAFDAKAFDTLWELKTGHYWTLRPTEAVFRSPYLLMRWTKLIAQIEICQAVAEKCGYKYKVKVNNIGGRNGINEKLFVNHPILHLPAE